jgi:hypothetical protein
MLLDVIQIIFPICGKRIAKSFDLKPQEVPIYLFEKFRTSAGRNLYSIALVHGACLRSTTSSQDSTTIEPARIPDIGCHCSSPSPIEVLVVELGDTFLSERRK